MKLYSDFSSYCDAVSTGARTITEADIQKIQQLILRTAKKNRTIFLIGNGGSAATASHFAADFAKGIYYRSKLRIKILALTDNTSYVTAFGNDLSYEQIFSDQIRALGEPNDLVIAISASGNSPNLIAAVKQAKKMHLTTVGFVGFDGGKLKKICEYCLHAKTNTGAYGPSEDIHAMLFHYLIESIISQV